MSGDRSIEPVRPIRNFGSRPYGQKAALLVTKSESLRGRTIQRYVEDVISTYTMDSMRRSGMNQVIATAA